MLWKTHFFAGAAAGLLITGHTDIKTAAVSAGVAGVAALLPDIDDPHSTIGRVVPVISWLIKKTTGHRGPLHSLLGAGIFFVLISIILHSARHDLALIGLAGYLSHLVVDSLNPQGVPWLWPVKKHFGIPITTTGSFIERLVVTPGMLMVCAYFALKSIGLF